MNTIVFDRNKFGIIDDLYEDVKRAIQLLIENEYNVSFRYEDAGIYILEFDHSDEQLAQHHLCWLTEREMEAVDDYNIEQERKLVGKNM